MLSFPIASSHAIGCVMRINAIDSGEFINLKIHSGGMTLTMCVKSVEGGYQHEDPYAGQRPAATCCIDAKS